LANYYSLLRRIKTLITDSCLFISLIVRIDLRAIILFFGNGISNEDIGKALSEHISNKLVSEKKWLNISRVLCNRAAFVLATRVKCQAGNVKLKRTESLNKKISDLLTLNVFLERYEEVQWLLERMSIKADMRLNEKEAIAYAYLLSGRIENARLVWNGFEMRENETEYANYIRARNVAIVGPAVCDHDIGSEIDSFDLVIRTNIFEETEMKNLGLKTDICYYNGGKTRLLEQGQLFPLNGIKFIVLKGGVCNKLSDNGSSILHIHNYKLLYNASFMSIQRIVYHILHYRPKSIVLFNIDFYTGQTAYQQGYVGAKNKKLPIQSFITHDVIQNYVFTKRLYDLGYVGASYNAKYVLDMSKAVYIKRLERIYSHLKTIKIGKSIDVPT
jgi:hypothetical protein